MPVFELTEPPALKGNEEPLLLMLDGVAGGREVSIKVPLPFARSALLPTRRTVRFGDARARASFMKVGRPVKVLWEVMS
jgi:hypothetical protein